MAVITQQTQTCHVHIEHSRIHHIITFNTMYSTRCKRTQSEYQTRNQFWRLSCGHDLGDQDNDGLDYHLPSSYGQKDSCPALNILQPGHLPPPSAHSMTEPAGSSLSRPQDKIRELDSFPCPGQQERFTPPSKSPHHTSRILPWQSGPDLYTIHLKPINSIKAKPEN